MAGTLELELAQDADYVKAAEPFWSAPASSPAFFRIDSSLLAAFEGWPRITPPAKGKRIFQLRTYESPSYRDHLVKVQMFHSGEFEIFKNAGFQMVFFGDTLIGQRMPSLTYMLSFADSAELDAKWEVFPQRSGMEEALGRPAICVRSDCQQHHQPGSQPAGCFANLSPRLGGRDDDSAMPTVRGPWAVAGRTMPGAA